ncbi:MAG TPA: methyltransferase domain-containing protein, partial [Aggregatilineales bacterium]|nr:methyltransferase domain-containing protein [Aggregatilineales bacterium]
MSETRRVVQNHFSQSAENYSRSPIHASGIDLQWMLELHPLTGAERVLDVGTGIGYAAFAFAPHVKSVEGIDITPAMLEQAELAAAERGIENVTFSQGDVEAIPREDASYDIVLSRWCAHHYVNIRKAVAEIARVLRRGGVFILADSVVP